jgi:hypothetical protein
MAMLPQVVVINQSQMLDLPDVVSIFEGSLGIALEEAPELANFSGF